MSTRAKRQSTSKPAKHGKGSFSSLDKIHKVINYHRFRHNKTSQNTSFDYPGFTGYSLAHFNRLGHVNLYGNHLTDYYLPPKSNDAAAKRHAQEALSCQDAHPARALILYLDALGHDPHNHHWHGQVAKLYEQQGNTSKAIEHLRLAQALMKFNSLPHHKKAHRVSPLYASHVFKYYGIKPVEAYKYENTQNKKNHLPLYRKVAAVLAFVFSSLLLSSEEVDNSPPTQAAMLLSKQEPGKAAIPSTPKDNPSHLLATASHATPMFPGQNLPPTDSTAYGDGLLISTPPNSHPLVNARIILNYTGSKGNTTDTVYTNQDGEFSFADMTVFQGVNSPKAKWVMTHVLAFPNPGAAMNIYQGIDGKLSEGSHASIYNMYGRLVDEVPVTTHTTTTSGRRGVAHAYWDGRDKPQGAYLYQFNGKATKIINNPNGRVAPRICMPSQDVIEKAAARSSTCTTAHNNSTGTASNYQFTISSTGSSNFQSAAIVQGVELVEGYNSINLEITPSAYRYFASGESNAQTGWIGFVKESNDQDTVFKSFLNDGGYETDTVFLEGQSTQMRVVGEADGFRPLDEIIEMNWDGMVVNPQFEDDSVLYSISGSAGPNGESLLFLDGSDTLGTSSVSDESYSVSFSKFWNDSVSSVRIKGEYSTLIDTIVGVDSGANVVNLPVYDQVLEYVVLGSAGPNGDTVRVIAGDDSVSSVVSDNEYEVMFNKFWQDNVDSVRVKSSFVDSVIGVSVGENVVNLPVQSDSIEYLISGSAGPNGDTVRVIAGDDSVSSVVSNNEYEVMFNKFWQDPVDSVRMKSSIVDTMVNVEAGDNIVNLPEYQNVDIAGYLRRHTYPYQGNLVNTKGMLIFEGLNINYEDSIQANDYGLYQMDDLLIPPNGTGEYKVTITPTNNPFMDCVDTISVTPGSEQVDFTVLGWPQYTRLKGNVRGMYNDNSLENVIVRFVDKNADTVLAQTVTDENGDYMLPVVEKQHEGKWEVGFADTAQGYLADVGNELVLEETLANGSYVTCADDTLYTVNWSLVPYEIPIPATENDPHHGQTFDLRDSVGTWMGNTAYGYDQIWQMIRGPPGATGYTTDTEEAMSRRVRLNYGDMDGSDKQLFEDNVIRSGDSLFYGISRSTPINDPSRPFELVTETIYDGSISDYHPVTHTYQDSLGFNVSVGPNTTVSGVTQVDNNKTYVEAGALRGDITVDLTDIAGNLKEIYGRTEEYGNISVAPSFMQINAYDPTLADRAIVYMIHKDNEKRWQQDDMQTYYPKKNVTYSLPER